MEFRIADTFTDSLGRLTATEQTAAKTTAFDLQSNPALPSLNFHRLDKTKDRNFWSVRVNADIRMIIHRTESSLLMCFVGHHDKAYAWAERRKLEVHPQTGAAQLVELRETVKEFVIPRYVETEMPARPIFRNHHDDVLLGYGVPTEWLTDVRNITNEDQLLKLAEHLPQEASDALLSLFDGKIPEIPTPVTVAVDPFSHPDALRRFRVMNNVEELRQALEFPWEKWSVFLHPVQRELAEREFSGPARVTGTAGTGKTIVALHRAVHLARSNPDARILLTTFSDVLANALRTKLRVLISSEPRLGERIEVHSMKSISRRLFELKIGKPQIADRVRVAEIIATVIENDSPKFSLKFIVAEWEQIVDAWQIKTWEQYRTVNRLGRKTGLPESQRAQLWSVFEKVNAQLESAGMITENGIYGALEEKLSDGVNRPFDFAVVDEAQDLSPAQLKFLRSLAGTGPSRLFFAGDTGQRIFQHAFSWSSLGVDIRGRSRSLKINYRTSHQIRSTADHLLEPEITDGDGVTEERRGTVSIFNGPPPRIQVYSSQKEETEAVGVWIKDVISEGVKPHEIGIFVRSEDEIARATSAAEFEGESFKRLNDSVDATHNHIAIGTMHLAKGLEFRAVAVMACDDEVIPSQKRIEEVGDTADLKEIYNTERQLLYVACTRARDFLLVTSAEYPSEFLDDLGV